MKKAIGWIVALLLAIFFAFVGWNKAFASLSDLARYGAWTAHLPESLGRIVGWSEIACAVALLAPRARFWAALLLFINQLAAAAVHLAHGETAALPQNAALVVLLSLLAYSSRSKEEKA